MTGAADKPLSGERVLIVEDRYLLASALAADIEKLGGRVIGLERSLAAAAALIEREPVDAVLLDINLEGELAYPFAETLAKRDVPFIFLTGYVREVLPAAWRDRPCLAKPVDVRQLGAALRGLANARSSPP